MDLEAYTAVNRGDWERLQTLSRTRRLTAAEIDELTELYGVASTHLSVIQAQDPHGPQARGLSLIVAGARQRLSSTPGDFTRAFTDFVIYRLPYAFYTIRWLTLVLGALFCAVATAYGAWVYQHPEVANALMSEQQQEIYVEHEFVGYYSENPAASFAGQVWTNNAWIAAQEVAFGITGFFVPVVLYLNAANVGVAGGIMARHGETDTFFNYILPHGYMELTAIFIAGAAGLYIFWSWVAPGRHTRLFSLARAGRMLITVAIGLVVVLFVSGLVEGFVTPAEIPDVLRHGIGLLVLAAYWCYTWSLGARAARMNLDADVGQYDGGTVELTA